MAKDELASTRKHIDTVLAKAVAQLHDIKKRYEEEKDLIRDNPKLAAHYPLDERQHSITKLEDLIEKKKNREEGAE